MSMIPYLVGLPPAKPEPLSRYLPPIPEGVVRTWLQTNLPRGAGETKAAWVLEPFGATPRVAIEAARAGYRVLVAANNPVTRFLLEMAASPPADDELISALAELAASRRGDERLELHIRSLYHSNCNICSNEVEVEAFLWDRVVLSPQAEKPSPSGPVPFAKIYHCPQCNTQGEHPITEEDLARAAQFSTSSLHRARALERVAPLDDPDRHHAEEALSVYLPRSVYALFNLINRLDGMSLAPQRRNHLTALLLSACDLGNALWPYPSGRARPRALTIPPKFRENNLWFVLEQAIQQWSHPSDQVALSTWPEQPPHEGGISIFEGRWRDLAAELADIPIEAVVTALPRPNHAFWTLSALWAGWLWGQEAVRPFKSVLRRRRYDWNWHTTALHAAFENLPMILKPGSLFLGLIGEADPGFLSAALVAADNANFELSGIAMPTEGGQAQINWRLLSQVHDTPYSEEERVLRMRTAARDYLSTRGEPSHYLPIHTAVLSSLAQIHALRSSEQAPMSMLVKINTAIDEALSYRGGLLRFGGSEKSMEVGYWWLRETDNISSALADRVEIELVQYLIAHPGASLPDIYSAICHTFPGLLTPSAELIQICLESYGEETSPGSGDWHIQAQNTPSARKTDLKDIASLIIQMGANLGYQVEGDQPILWRDAANQVAYAWHVTASAVIGDAIFNQDYAPGISLVALPGGRANLVAFKLQHDPRLRQAFEEGWRFVKYRHLRWLAQNPILSRDTLDHLLTQDTLTYESPQMRLF